MKKTIKYIFIIGLLAVINACSDFDEINQDPNAASEDQVNVMWMLNKSITDAQMDPHIQERIFVYYWMDAARMQYFGALTSGYNSDAFNHDYLNSYVSSWMKSAKQMIDLADRQLVNNKLTSEHDIAMTKNLKEVGRIWYVYLLSEFTDNFGPAPLDPFQEKTPTYSSVKDVYYFMLDELKDAQSKIDVNVKPDDSEKKFDRAYEFDFTKWKKYANAMRMRLAMRLSEIDAAKAKTEFEDAAKSDYIASTDDIFRVKERDGWDPLAGVMSRSWNDFTMGSTFANIIVGLGGVKTADLITADKYKPYIKGENYLGRRLQDHWPTYTNDPYTGFFMDGLPYSIDPRFFTLYSLPLDNEHKYNPTTVKKDGKDVINSDSIFFVNKVAEEVPKGEKPTKVDSVNIKYSINGYNNGNWGDAGSANGIYGNYYKTAPVLQKVYRESKNHRVFYGDWESYFLIAEAAVRGWNVPLSAKEAYEKGIKASFSYSNADESHLSTYLASKAYNRVGTSVSWDHTAEPPASVEMDIVNGYTHKAEKFTYKYPIASQTFYGKALNDQLTKIITQKYIAQMPWLALEVWNDHRRLGLPFFENLAVEKPLTRMSWLTQENAKNSQSYKFFPQRIRYPSSLENSNPNGYNQALDFLGEGNDVFTPLWWAKH
ncbi:MAG: SusD/RagB family nutrient-binding outer membrane lipoprotein [Bacteroidia bacterium]|nr:SusD/RagB family nutrient-binding outer membrane lipoprotein [Bacteroidia bacterium]